MFSTITTGSLAIFRDFLSTLTGQAETEVLDSANQENKQKTKVEKNMETMPCSPFHARLPRKGNSKTLGKADNEAERLIIGDTFSHYESKQNEFKEAQCRDSRVCELFDRYAGAFLNADGGDLWLGIADDGCIIGINCDRKRYDDLCLAFDQIAAKGYSPAIDPSLYDVKLIPLGYRNATTRKVCPSSKVLMCISFRSNPNNHLVYKSTNFGNCVRACASVRHLSPEAVRDRRKFGKVTSSSRPSPSGNSTSSTIEDTPHKRRYYSKGFHPSNEAYASRKAGKSSESRFDPYSTKCGYSFKPKHEKFAHKTYSRHAKPNDYTRAYAESTRSKSVIEDAPLRFPRSIEEYESMRSR